jgi:uridine phosphorylase
MSFPLVPAKRSHDSILDPQIFAQHNEGWLGQQAAPEVALLLFHRGLAEQVAERRGAEKIESFLCDYFVMDEFDGRVALVANFGIGAPAAVFMTEDMIGAGAHTILCIGTSGGLHEGAQPGDIVLCDRALRDEGTSYHYVAGDVEALPDPTLTDRLGASLESMGVEYRRGATWTTDAPYRETALELRQHREAGVLTVEMEASAVFCVARLRGAKSAALLTISDVLEESNWTPSFHAAETMESLNTMVDAALVSLS